MGWVCEADGRHEGYFVALVPIVGTGYRFRELDATTEGGPRPIRFVQVACECGWRSPRLFAPVGSTWSSNHVEIPQDSPPSPMRPQGVDHPIENAAIAMWQAHTREIPPGPGGKYLINLAAEHGDRVCSDCGGTLTVVDDVGGARSRARFGDIRKRPKGGKIPLEAGDRVCPMCSAIFKASDRP